MKSKSKTKSKRNWTMSSFYNLFVCIAIADYVVYSCSRVTDKEHVLKDHGIKTKGYVYDSYSQRSHTWYLYEFTVNGQNYYGRLFNSAHIGDSIWILYMRDDPSTNMGLFD